MTFPLTENDAESYLKALKLMKSAGISNYEDKVCQLKEDLNFLVDMLYDTNILILKTDPVRTQYPFSIKARDILKTILKNVKQIIVDKKGHQNKITGTSKKSNKKNIKGGHEDDKNKQQLQRLEAVIHLQLGKILWRTEDVKEGEKELSKCWLILENDDKDDLTIQVKQEVLNECGILNFEHENLEKSVKYFEEANKFYKNLKDHPSPWCVDDFFRAEAYNPQFNDDKKRNFVFKNNFTQTLYYLTLINLRLKNVTEAASCILQILFTQLDNHSYDAYDWSKAAANLSIFFQLTGDFRMARHCLAAAETVLKQEGDCPSNLFVMVPKDLSKEEVDAKEKFPRIWAGLYRFWADYCISLLEFSDIPSVSRRDGFSFQLDVTECESQVRAEKVVSFEGARQVFLKGQAWLNRSKEFFHLQGDCSKYAYLVIANGTLFSTLTQFETDGYRKCKMLKRKIDMLTELLNQINQQLYPSLCNDICFDLGTVYYLMALLKLFIFHDQCSQQPSTLPNTKAAEKITSLAHKSIEFSTRFINYHRDPQGKLPETLKEFEQVKLIKAHFFIAQIYTKVWTEESQEVSNLTKAINNYSFIVEYCHKHPSAAQEVVGHMNTSVSEIPKLSAKILEMKSHQ